jgi:hypothetical protein
MSGILSTTTHELTEVRQEQLLQLLLLELATRDLKWPGISVGP